VAATVHGSRREKLTLSQILRYMKSRDIATKREAWQSLLRLGEDAKPALPDVIKATEDSDPWVRASAYHGLSLLRLPPAERIPLRIRGLRDPAPEVRRQCLRDLRFDAFHLKQDIHAALPDLLVLIDDDDRTVRQAAFSAIAAMGARAQAALPQLRKLLNHEDSRMKNRAISTMGAIGPAAREHLPQIIGFVTDLEGKNSNTAIEALVKIAPHDGRVLECLTNALKHPDKTSRVAAAQAIGTLGPEAKEAIPALEEAMDGELQLLRIAAGQAIISIDPTRQDVMLKLVEEYKNWPLLKDWKMD
jgi:HEAT repeat protein